MTLTRTDFIDYADANAWALFPINGEARPNAWQSTKPGDYERERLAKASGLGVVLEHSSLAVIDIDVQNGGTLEAVEAEFGLLPQTFTVSTPSGGVHLYFTLPRGVDPLAKINGRLIKGVDLLCRGCYVAGPTTVREATEKKPGGTYEVVNGIDPVELPAAVLAAWVAHGASRAIARPTSTLTQTHSSRYADVRKYHLENVVAAAETAEGERDDVSMRMIFASVALALGVPDNVLSLRDVERDYAAIEAFEIKDLTGKIDRALNAVTARTFGERIVVDDRVNTNYTPSALHISTPEMRSDAAQIDRLTDMLAGQVIYTAAGWYAWNSIHWERVDSIGWVIKEACKLAWMDLRAVSEPTKEQISAVNHWNRPGFWQAAETSLKDEPRLKRKMTELDAHLHLLNARNGTIDLRTGELLPHRPEDYITRVADTEYDPNAKFPRWEQFVEEIFPGVDGMPAYLQRFLGYSISGETTVHVYPVWVGIGRNGKSVLIEAVQAALGGQYMVNVRTEALEQGGNAQETELARLRGARLAVLSETNQGMRVDEAALKRWTGDTGVVARELYGRAFSYDRQFQIVQVTNHEPRFASQGVALWERVRLVRFNRVFQAHEQDRTLPIQLQSDEARRGILAWMVQGAVDFYSERRLIDVPQIEDFTTEYKADQNPLDDFLRSGQVAVDPDAWEAGPALFELYRQICDDRGMSGEAVKRNTFYALLVENGFEQKRKKDRGRGFAGIRIDRGSLGWGGAKEQF